MDPNETLKQLRDAIKAVTNPDSEDRLGVRRTYDLIYAFEALDEWLSKGGFLPDDWHEFHSACPPFVQNSDGSWSYNEVEDD